MDIKSLIEALSAPDVYPEEVETVEVCQTHISVVFLTEQWAYKIKKPVALDFVDYSTLQKRKHFCDREVKLNRRLAPEVYRGVVPITGGDAGIQVDGDPQQNEVLEWAVKMVRLPDEATLQSKLRAGEVSEADFQDLAVRLADFYANADRGEEISAWAEFEAVTKNIRDNLDVAEQKTGELLHPDLYERLETAVERALDNLRSVIESRAEEEIPRDCHGDLRLEHVYSRPEREGMPFAIVDCIEFNDAFRYADPLEDVAFMMMDLQHEGAWSYANDFKDAYLEECRELGGEAAKIATHPSATKVRQLLRLYISYRAAVRGKVESLKVDEEEVSLGEREDAGLEAIAFWLQALGALETPSERPALFLVAGLPGTGKSTLARGLERDEGCVHLDSDVIRKEAAGLGPDEPAPTEPKGGLYADCWSDETYRMMRERARSVLVRGGRVVAEATFRSRERRERFWELAEHLAVPVVLLVCEASDEEVERRLRDRDSGPSDAGVEVYRQLRDEWEPIEGSREECVVRVSTESEPEETVQRAIGALRRRRLVS